MKINNYDMSSTGTNIEFTLYRDEDLGRIEWHESFERIGGTDWLCVHTDYGNSTPLSEIPISRLQLWDVIGSADDAKFFVDYYEPYNLEAFIDAYLNHYDGCSATVTKMVERLTDNLTVAKLAGYSQGDEVWIIHEKEGMDINYLHQRFFDQPLGGALTVNDTEIYINEFSYYEWDKEKFLEWLVKFKLNNEAMAFLEKTLPKYI